MWLKNILCVLNYVHYDLSLAQPLQSTGGCTRIEEGPLQYAFSISADVFRICRLTQKHRDLSFLPGCDVKKFKKNDKKSKCYIDSR